MNRLQGKKVAVIGLGISNIAVITYLLKQDLAKLSIFDTRLNPPYAEEVPGGIDFQLGPLQPELLKTFDILVVSPGLSISLPELKAAAEAGVEIVGDVELFADEVNAPVIGITGSNGKSTVTALVGFMLEKAGRRAMLGANFGNAVFDILSDQVEDYVLELSSFELETTTSLKTVAGVILNVSEDHLDRYDGDIEKYTQAKHRIFKYCDKIVVNREDPRTYPQDEEQKKHVFASFGFDNDPEQYGCEQTPTTTYLCVKGQRVLDARELLIYGRHNMLNALAAMAIADAVGVPREVQVQALKAFSGLEHRCQLVRVLDGVSFYNDSKATNVASAEAAIAGLADRHKDGIILLAGGLGKGQDFTPLKRFIGKEVSRIYCFGRDANKILELDKEHCISVINMRQAIRMAFETAKSGQAILLSPACASFDQFKGFDERGRVFVNLVNDLVTKIPQVQPRITTAGHVEDTPTADHALAAAKQRMKAKQQAQKKAQQEQPAKAQQAQKDAASIAASPFESLVGLAKNGAARQVLAQAKKGTRKAQHQFFAAQQQESADAADEAMVAAADSAAADAADAAASSAAQGNSDASVTAKVKEAVAAANVAKAAADKLAAANAAVDAAVAAKAEKHEAKFEHNHEHNHEHEHKHAAAAKNHQHPQEKQLKSSHV